MAKTYPKELLDILKEYKDREGFVGFVDCLSYEDGELYGEGIVVFKTLQNIKDSKDLRHRLYGIMDDSGLSDAELYFYHSLETSAPYVSYKNEKLLTKEDIEKL